MARKKSASFPVIIEGIEVGSIRLRYRTWQLRYRVNGIRQEIALRGLRDSQDALARAKIEISRADNPVPEASILRAPAVRTLQDGLDRYDDERLTKRRASTRRRALDTLQPLVDQIGPEKPMGILDRPYIKAWLARREKDVVRNLRTGAVRPISPYTVRSDFGRIRAWANWLRVEKYLPPAEDICAKIDLPPIDEDKAARGLSRQEVEVALAILDRSEEFYRDWFIVAINVGLRPGEEAHIRSCDYDPKSRKLKIRSWNHPTLGEWKVKTKRSKRVLPVNADAHEVLARRKLQAGESENLLFPTSVGTVWHLDTLRHRFQDLLPDGSYFTSYALRHTFAYTCVSAEWDVAKLSLYMGHSDVKTTMGYWEGMDLEEIGAPPISTPSAVAMAE